MSLPPGWRARIDRLAQREALSSMDWARQVMRRAIESGEQAARRERQEGDDTE